MKRTLREVALILAGVAAILLGLVIFAAVCVFIAVITS